MSFLSGIGNIFHSIGNFFAGGGDDEQKKKQQQMQLGGGPAPISRAQLGPTFTQQDNGPGSVAQPQKQDQLLNLFQPNGNTPLVKANPAFKPQPQVQIGGPVEAPAPAPPPKPHASIIHDITHNPVTNVVGGVGKAVAAPFEYLAKADIIDPTRELAAEFSGNRQAQINAERSANMNLGLGEHGTDFGGGLRKWAGNSAGALLTVAAPGLESGIEHGTEAAATRFLSGTGAEDLIPSVTKYGTRFITGGALNTGLSAGQEYANGMNPGEILKKAPEQFGVGGVIGEAAPPLLGGLRKITGSMGSRLMSAFRGDANVPEPSELAVGIKSSNPTQAADAAQVHGQNLPPEQPQPAPISTEPAAPTELQKAATDLNTPAYQRAPLKVAAANEEAAARAAQEQAVAPDQPTDSPAFQHKAALQDVVSQGEQELNDWANEHPEATPQDIETARQSIAQQVMAKVDQLNEARYSAENPVAAPTEPAVPTPSGSAEAAPVAEPLPLAPTVPEATPAVADVQPAVNPQPTAPIAERPLATPDQAGVDSGIPKNERFRDAVMNQSRNQHFVDALKEDVPTKDQPALAELSQQAKDVVANKTPAQLINDYGRENSFAGNAQQAHEALEAVRVLEQMGDPVSAEAAANALNTWNDFASRSGYDTRSTALAYQDMPATMKVAYIQKLVQRAGGEALTEADIARLTKAAELQTEFAKTAEDALGKVTDLASKANEADPAFNAAMKEALAVEDEANSNLYDQNREVVSIIEKNVPKSALGDRLSQSARTMMLSSVGGRVFALTGTAFNAANYVADKTLSGLYGRVINKVGGVLGKVNDTNAVETARPRVGTLIKGGVKGAKGLVQEVYGQAPVKSVEQHLKTPYDTEYSHDTVKYGRLGKITEPFRKLVKTGVGSHMALTKGVEDSALESSARAAAKAADVPKSNMKGFVDYYVKHPPKAVAEEAKQAWLGVNNLHNNNVSDALGKVADGIENLGGKDPKSPVHAVLKQVRTTIMPFTKYMGGVMDKMLTDRNVFYNAFRIAAARSPQELADQFAHLTTNVAGGLGIGYLLAKDGIITNKDAHGNSYDGLYFHIGDRYIGVEWAGQFAAPIIMGAELHGAGTNSTPTSWPVNVINDLMKASGVAGTFGDTSSTGALFAGDAGRGLPQVAGTAVRQHIPGFFGDINSFLNHGHLNPTGEAPLTKVTEKNPATGRQVTNVAATELNKTKALIPGLSQELPRKAGEQAPDFVDRMLHSSHSSAEEKQAAVDQKVAADQATADKQAGIPNPAPGAYAGTNDTYAQALQATIERGEYDKAIESIKQDINQKQNDKNVAPSTLTELKAKATQFGIAKNGGLKYDDMKLYNSTSVSEWRKMGDPEDDNYDPATYQKLWAIDEALAKAGVAGSFLIGDSKTSPSDKQKYSEKSKKSSSRSSRNAAARHAESLIKGNTVGSSPDLKNISFGDLSPIKLDNFKIPIIQKIPADQLVKKRTISVKSGV